MYGGTFNNIFASPRRRLVDLVTPLDDRGKLNPKGRFIRSGASTISREQGNRLIAVKFSVRERDLAGAVGEAQEKTKAIFKRRIPPNGAASSRKCRKPNIA